MRMTRENLYTSGMTICDHSQGLGLLQKSKLLEKAVDGNVPHVRRLQRFKNPCKDDIREHGTQGWSYDRASRQHFCARKPASSVIFRSGHSIQNRTECNWCCTLLQKMDDRFNPAVSVEGKDCWWLSVVCMASVNFFHLALPKKANRKNMIQYVLTPINPLSPKGFCISEAIFWLHTPHGLSWLDI